MNVSNQERQVRLAIVAVVMGFIFTLAFAFLLLGDLQISAWVTSAILLIGWAIEEGVCQNKRKLEPCGMHYYPYLGWIRWGWWGRFDREPDDPASIGVRVSSECPGRCVVILRIIQEEGEVSGRVLGYWTDETWFGRWRRRWHFRPDRPLKKGTVLIAAKIRFPEQYFSLWDQRGRQIQLVREDHCLPEDVKGRYPDAEVV